MDNQTTKQADLNVLSCLRCEQKNISYWCTDPREWTQRQLEELSRYAEARGQQIPERLKQILISVNTSPFFWRSETSKVSRQSDEFRLLTRPSYSALFQFDVTVLVALDLQPGHSILVIVSEELGNISHVAGHLVHPGGANLLYCTKSDSYDENHQILSNYWRLYPQQRRNCVSPMITNSMTDALYMGKTYDRIVVRDNIVTLEHTSFFERRLKPGGRLVCRLNGWPSVLVRKKENQPHLTRRLLMLSQRHRFSDYYLPMQDFLDITSPLPEPLPLKILTMRAAITTADPIAKHLPPRRHRHQIVGCHDRYLDKPTLRDVENSFKRLVGNDSLPDTSARSAVHATRVRFSEEVTILREEYLDRVKENESQKIYRTAHTRTLGEEAEEKPLMSFYIISQIFIRWKTSSSPFCPCVFLEGKRNAHCKVRKRFSREVWRARIGFLTGAVFRHAFSKDDVDEVEEVAEHHRELLKALRQKYAPDFRPVGMEAHSLNEELTEAAARLVSDARAMQNILSSPLTTQSPEVLRLQRQLKDMEQEMEAAGLGHCNSGDRWVKCEEYWDVITNMAAENLLFLDSTMISISKSLDHIVTALDHIPAHSCDKWSGIRPEIDPSLFRRRLTALDQHTPKRFAVRADFIDFLAARFLYDAGAVVRYARRVAAKGRAERLATDPKAFLRHALDLPESIKQMLIAENDLESVFVQTLRPVARRPISYSFSSIVP